MASLFSCVGSEKTSLRERGSELPLSFGQTILEERGGQNLVSWCCHISRKDVADSAYVEALFDIVMTNRFRLIQVFRLVQIELCACPSKITVCASCSSADLPFMLLAIPVLLSWRHRTFRDDVAAANRQHALPRVVCAQQFLWFLIDLPFVLVGECWCLYCMLVSSTGYRSK